jgi:hypothetical protein
MMFGGRGYHSQTVCMRGMKYLYEVHVGGSHSTCKKIQSKVKFGGKVG